MGDGKHTVVIVGARDEEDAIRRQLDEIAEVLAVEPDPEAGLGAVREKSPTIALLFLDHESEAILSIARHLSANSGSAVIVVSRNRDPDNILLAMRSGVRDFAYLDQESNDVRRAVESVEAQQTREGGDDSGKVITVFSAKGGSGATTVASNIAGALLTHGKDKDEEKRKVVLLDFDLEMGDVLVFLDLESRFSYVELLNNIHRLDKELLYRSLAVHPSGLNVLSQTDQVEEARDVNAQEMTEVIGFLRKNYDFIVIDGLRDFRETALVALDSADTVVLTMTQDIPALKNANRCLRLFKRLGYKDEKIKLVVNRYRGSGQLNTDAVSDALRKRVDGTVANDFPTSIKAINQGQLLVELAPSSRVAKDLRNLVSIFYVEEAPVKKKGLFGMLGRR
jgi:pilus assembly protein CpaE